MFSELILLFPKQLEYLEIGQNEAKWQKKLDVKFLYCVRKRYTWKGFSLDLRKKTYIHTQLVSGWDRAGIDLHVSLSLPPLSPSLQPTTFSHHPCLYRDAVSPPAHICTFPAKSCSSERDLTSFFLLMRSVSRAALAIQASQRGSFPLLTSKLF